MFKRQPKIAYFISKITYDNFGYDEIERIELFKDKIDFLSKYEYYNEFMILLSSIYKDNYDYEKEALNYLEYAEKLRKQNDTLHWNLIMAKFLAANKANGDFITSTSQVNLNYDYFVNTFSPVIEKTSTKLLISEGLDLFSYLNNNLLDGIKMSELQDILNFYSVYEDDSNLCDVAVSQGNVALFLRRVAWNEATESFNDTILEKSKILYQKSIANFERGNCRGYDYAKTIISFANTYAYCDSVDLSNKILGKVDTTGMSLYLQLIYSKRRAKNEISLKNHGIALSILRNIDSKVILDSWPKCYYQRILEEKIKIKNLIRSLTENSQNNSVSSEIIDLYSEFDNIREKNQLRSVALSSKKVSNKIEFLVNEINKKKDSDSEPNKGIKIFIAVILLLFLTFLSLVAFYSTAIPSEKIKKDFFVNGKVKIKYGDIVVIKKEPAANYVKYHLKDGRQLTEYITIEKLINGDEKTKRAPMPPGIFLKTSQSFIINIFELSEILKGTEGLLMSNKEIAGISPDQKEQIVKKIESHSHKKALDFIYDAIKKDIFEFYNHNLLTLFKK